MDNHNSRFTQFNKELLKVYQTFKATNEIYVNAFYLQIVLDNPPSVARVRENNVKVLLFYAF